VAILDAVRSLRRPVFLVTNEQPESWELIGFQLMGEHTWTIPQSAATTSLVDGILESGNWRVYAADDPVPLRALPDLFRLDETPSDAGIGAVLVDAWHDSVEWRLYVPALSTQGES
jgi:hypothetical protein